MRYTRPVQYQKLSGIVINRRIVGDADYFLTVLTKEEGKLSVYAHSVRSTKSKRAPSLDLFNAIIFEVSKKGDHRTLTHVELKNSFRTGKKTLSDISRLFALGELIDALLPEDDPHPEVYHLLHTALTHLSRFQTPDYLFRFKLKLLKLLGYGDRPLTPELVDSYIESLLDRQLNARQII